MSVFEKIKRYYDKGLYNRSHLATFVLKGVISQSQMDAMIGVEVKE